MLLAFSLAGCGGAGSSTPGMPCPAITVPQPIPPPTLIAPAPASTGVPASGLTIVISAQATIDEQIRLLGADGSNIVAGPLTASPTADHPQAVSAAVPALSPHTQYAVYVFGTTPVTPATGCVPAHGGPYQLQTLFGTFTTQ
jgi:hypothetical protein